MKDSNGFFHHRLKPAPWLLPLFLLVLFLVLSFGCDTAPELSVPERIRLQNGSVASGEPFELQVSGVGLDSASRAVLTRDIGNRSQVINELPLWGTVVGVELQGNFAYLANNNKGLIVADVSDINAPVVAGSLDLPGKTLKAFPYGDLLVTANELSGVQLVDISEPSKPRLISSIATRGRAFDLDIAEDLLFVAEGLQGLLVVDIKRPEQPVVVARLALPGRSLAVKVVGNSVYLAGTEVLAVVDISSAEHPVLLKSLALEHNGFQIVRDDKRIFVPLGPEGILVVDIGSPELLKPIGRVSDLGHVARLDIENGRAYLASHLGTLVLDLEAGPIPELLGGVMGTNRVTDVAVRHGIALSTDTAHGLEVIDLRRPVQFGFTSSQFDGQHPVVFNVAERRFVNSLLNEYMLVPKYNKIRIFQLLDDGQPYYFISDGTSAVQHATSVYLGTDSGVLTLDIDRSDESRLLDRSPDAQAVEDLVLAGDYLYGAAGLQGLLVYHLNSAGFPELIQQVPVRGFVSAIAMEGDVVYLTGIESGLTLFDVQSRANPELLGSVGLPYPLNEFSHPSDVVVHNGWVYIADGPNGFMVVDVTDPYKPTLAVLEKTVDSARNITIEEPFLYVADSRSGVMIYDISRPEQPVFISRIRVPVSVRFFTIFEDTLGVATLNTTLFWNGKPIEACGKKPADPDAMTFTFPAVNQPGRYSLRVFNEAGGEELIGAVSIGEIAEETGAK